MADRQQPVRVFLRRIEVIEYGETGFSPLEGFKGDEIYYKVNGSERRPKGDRDYWFFSPAFAGRMPVPGDELPGVDLEDLILVGTEGDAVFFDLMEQDSNFFDPHDTLGSFVIAIEDNPDKISFYSFFGSTFLPSQGRVHRVVVGGAGDGTYRLTFTVGVGSGAFGLEVAKRTLALHTTVSTLDRHLVASGTGRFSAESGWCKWGDYEYEIVGQNQEIRCEAAVQNYANPSFVWLLEDCRLIDASGEIEIPCLTGHPRPDGFEEESGGARIKYAIHENAISLWNVPRDGQYSVTIGVEVVEQADQTGDSRRTTSVTQLFLGEVLNYDEETERRIAECLRRTKELSKGLIIESILSQIKPINDGDPPPWFAPEEIYELQEVQRVIEAVRGIRPSVAQDLARIASQRFRLPMRTFRSESPLR